MRKVFDIKYRPEIESGKMKVVTVDNRPVTILRWDMKGNYPILACTMVKQCNWEGDESWEEERPFAYNTEGHAAGAIPAHKLDLFLVAAEPELTEFEDAFLKIIKDCDDPALRKNYQEYVREASAALLTIARKELLSGCKESSAAEIPSEEPESDGCGIEFPFFGAKYPDARCCGGYLYDMDSWDESLGGFTVGGDDPCPVCNTEKWLEGVLNGEQFYSKEEALEYVAELKKKYLDRFTKENG